MDSNNSNQKNQEMHSMPESSLGGRRPTSDDSGGAAPSQQSHNNQVSAAQSAPRRKFSIDYKVKILAANEACDTPLARGELLRNEGLYHSRIIAWRQQRDAGRFNKQKTNNASSSNQHLKRENDALKKKLAQAEAIIEIQKKISDLLGMNTQEQTGSED